MEPLRSRMNASSVKFRFTPYAVLFGLQAPYRGILIYMGRLRATNPVPPSRLKQGDLRALLFQGLRQVLGLEPHGGGIVIGMYTDQSGVLQKELLQEEGRLVFPVVEQAKGALPRRG